MSKTVSSSSFLNYSKSQSRANVNKELKCCCDVKSLEKEEIKKESEKSDEESEISENKETKKSLWQEILEESKESKHSYENWLEEQEQDTNSTENVDSPANYLNKEIFPILLTAMEKMLKEAQNLDVLRVQKSRFNGLDYLAEYLWNSNPKWSSRTKWLDVYEIPQFKLSLRFPRPIFPKSWLWSIDEAATRIQRFVRGWLVRKQEDVQEMRQFWKLIKNDKESLELSEDSGRSKDLNMCERYKLLAKKREKPF